MGDVGKKQAVIYKDGKFWVMSLLFKQLLSILRVPAFVKGYIISL